MQQITKVLRLRNVKTFTVWLMQTKRLHTTAGRKTLAQAVACAFSFLYKAKFYLKGHHFATYNFN
jgi:hypothetical protein